jgi:bifunctional DNase/RNase
MVEMQLVAVRVELPTNTPVVLLQESEGARRTLPIFVGTPEATAIAYALQGVVPPRPMTHDLMRDLLDVTNVHVDSVVITELRGSTYYAEINLRQAGEQWSVSSRPSDAIALAARMGTPIYADDDLVENEGVVLAGEDEAEIDESEAEDLVSQFRHFIDEVSPEDFTPPPSGH